ncbi:MAG: isochorismatase family protein [Pseudomonadota bacterium]|nr:isochorismatase family protein [Pseudomonadota bacterium]
MKEPLSIELAHSAALFVDLQEEHRRDSRYLVHDFDAIIANVQRIQSAARAAAVPLFHSAYVVDPADHAHRPLHPVMADGTSVFSDINDPHTAICAEVAPAAGEVMYVKTDASSLVRGDLPAMLRERAVEWLVVAGVWTEACVAATVKDAVELGFRVILVKDACGSGSMAMHQTAILNIANRLYGGAVTGTEGACRLLAGETVDAWRVRGSVPIRFGYDDAERLYHEL